MTQTIASPVATPAPAPRRSGWPLATVLIVLILTVGIPMGYLVWSFAQAPHRIASAVSQNLAEAMRPKLTMNEIVINSIADLHKESKLVVFTADLNTDVTREEGTSAWGMYWGTNVARVAVRDARVQYVIDLANLQTSDFIYSDNAKVLTLFVPKPKIDATMVAIDPGKIQTVDLRGGWALWNKQDTKDRAIAELRPKIITQAQAPFVKELAESSGIETTTHFLQPLADAVSKDGVSLHVTYRD